MPRRRKAPYLYLRPARADRAAQWVIRDGPQERSTGCGERDTEGAAKALAAYLAERFVAPGALAPSELLVVEVVTVYLKEHAQHSVSRDFLFATAKPILEWWADFTLADINADKCRQYVEWRLKQHRKLQPVKEEPEAPRPLIPISEQTARHELKTLRTAINWYHREHGPLPSKPVVTLPDKAAPRVDYWLSRKEVAARLRAARRNPYLRHVARLILIGVYTGTRPGAILGLKWIPSTTDGWFDLERGILHRRGTKARRSKKRQPPARIPDRLLPHLRRWRRADLALGISSVVHFQGEPVKKLRRSWASVAKAAGATKEDGPHIVRHTAATWLMQAGVELFEAAGYLGMSPETLWQTYGHHHPDFQTKAAKASLGRGRRG